MPVPAATRELLGAEIRVLAASAEQDASGFARVALEHWLERVQARTEAEFIPWATDYWTQQWLAVKLAWYRAGDSGDERAGIARLTEYLYDGYRSKVLDPVQQETDPVQIMDEATVLYASTLSAGIEELRDRHAMTRQQFGAWLNELPAISVPPGASLRDLVEAEAVTQLAAYQALTATIRHGREGSGLAGCRAVLQTVAERAAERVAATLAVRGAAAAASVLAGFPGVLLGVGISAWDAAAYEQERPTLEAALRSDLDTTLRSARWQLLGDREQGVLGPVTHIAEQLGAGLPEAAPVPSSEPGVPEELF